MRDCAELVKALRHCVENTDCPNCPYYTSCDNDVMIIAADAIEELLAENKAIKQSNKDDLFIATCNDSTGKDMTATFWTLIGGD